MKNTWSIFIRLEAFWEEGEKKGFKEEHIHLIVLILLSTHVS